MIDMTDDKDSIGVVMILFSLMTGFVGIPLFLGTGQPVLIIISIILLLCSQFFVDDGWFNQASHNSDGMNNEWNL